MLSCVMLLNIYGHRINADDPGAEIIFGASSLLWKVFTKPSYIVTSPECSSQDRIKVAMVIQMLSRQLRNYW